MSLDTGSVSTFFASELAYKLAPNQKIAQDLSFVFGDERNGFADGYMVSAVSVGSLRVPDSMIRIYDPSSGTLPTTLGIDVLAHSAILLDVEANVLYIRPTAGWNPSLAENGRDSFDVPYFGVTLIRARDGAGWVVTRFDGTAAPTARARLHPGDQFLAVNGYPVSALTLPQVYAALDRSDRGAGAVITLRRPGGDAPIQAVVRFDQAAVVPPTPPTVTGATSPSATSVEPTVRYTLRHVAQIGRTERMSVESHLTASTRWDVVTIHTRSTSLLTFSAVDENGDITVDDRVGKGAVEVNGIAQPDNGPDADYSLTVHPDGTLSGSAAEASVICAWVMVTPIFPDRPVGVGDTWTHDYPLNAAEGRREAHAEFSVVGHEVIDGVDSLKIAMTYGEHGAAPTIQSKGFVWIEIASGESIRAEFALHNLPTGESGDPYADGVVIRERIDGSPLRASSSTAGSASDAAGTATGGPQR